MNEKPWLDEPDRLEFEAHGFPCIIQRVGKEYSGHLCGYVGVDEKHPYHGKSYDEVELEAHGGLTYSEPCQGHICHVPKPGESDNIWWFGFDCAHAFDLTPWTYEQRQPGGILHDIALSTPRLTLKELYRDINYVKQECIDLAEQLKDAA